MDKPVSGRAARNLRNEHGPVRRAMAVLAALPRAIERFTFKQRAFTAAIAGALSNLAMAPFFFAPVLLLTLPLLVWLIDAAGREPSDGESRSRRQLAPWRKELRAAAATGWFFGLGYFLLGLFWIGEAFLVEAEKFAWLLPVAVTILPAGLALFFAAAAGVAKAFWTRGISRVLVLAIALGVAEWLRGHILTGLPWNVIGYALTYPLPLMQGTALIGVYGLTLIAVAAFALPLIALADTAGKPRTGSGELILGLLVPVGLLAGLWGFGAWRLASASDEMVPGVRLRIVQPSVPQREKWQAAKQGEIFQKHLSLSRRAADGHVDDLEGITHVIWPEAAMPFLPLDRPEALAAIADLVPDGVQLITGALRADPPTQDADGRSRRRIFNSLVVFGTDGQATAIYDKIHLVPFGEYLPFQHLLESIGLEQLTRVRGGFDIGPTPRPLIEIPGLPPFVGLICYEGIFPAAVVQGQARPGLIINVTNDGWFGDTTGPRQHFHMSRVRAVEEGASLVRAANNGISAMIDPYGRVHGRIGLDVVGVIDTALPQALPSPPYARFGDSIFWGMVLGLMLLAGVTVRRARAAEAG